MAEFGVGHQDAVVDQGRADSGAQRGDDHHSTTSLGRAVAHLGEPSGVRIVHQDDLTTQLVAEQLLGIDPDPRRVEVGHHRHDPVNDGRRHGDADRRVADLRTELFDDLGDHAGAGLRGRLLRRRDSNTAAGQGAGRQIDGGALDARSADVDAQDVVRGRSHASHARAWTGSRSGEADVNKGLRPKLAG